MKEKVSRPDRTGAWIGEAYGFALMPSDLSASDDYGLYGRPRILIHNDHITIANQAIEKMIASAREKE